MGKFIVGQPIPIRYYQGVSGTTIEATVIDESDGIFGAELTLVENAVLLAAGFPGYYENTFTPDAVGHWKALIYYAGVKVGQVFYDVGGGLTLQEKADVEAEAVDALESLDLDHLLKIAHPTGDPVADTVLDLIMNKDGGQTFARATDSLEIIGEVVAAILADTVTIAWGDITGIVNDIGVFPTANYATLAAYVEDIRTRLTDILADVTGINGDAMRGTDDAALAASWTAGLATILGNFSAVRIAYLDQLDFDLQEAIAALVTALGAEFDGTPNLYDVLVTGGIPAWPAAAAPANNISIAQVIREIYNDVTGLNGDVMRGTDGAALVADGWDAALATILDNFSALRITYIDELDFALQEAIAAIQTAVEGGTDAVNRVAGKPQVFATTVDLHQAAGNYDIATATTQAIVVDSIIFSPRVDVSDDVGGITAVTVQTDATTETEFIDNLLGAIVNLTAEAQPFWIGATLLRVGDKIQFTIEGGTADADPTTCDVIITFHATVNGGYLV